MKVFISGFMGAGKSTLLKKMAQLESLNMYSFNDLDREIEISRSSTIAQIINLEGIEKFREIEFAKLAKVALRREDVVISIGGGALHKASLDWIRKIGGVVVFLDTPFEECLRRIQSEKDGLRPLAKLSNMELRLLYDDRMKFYSKCDLKIRPDEEDKLIQYITSSTIN